MVGLRHYLLGVLACAGLGNASRCPPALQIDKKPQLFILTDITNEPDDSMSLVRLLVHSDQYNITGFAATTSYWLNSTVRPDAILNTTSVWNEVVDNLSLHSGGEYPSKEYLESIVTAGHPVYGTAVFKEKTLSSGAARLIGVAEGLAEDEILHVHGWGGVNTLAEALKHLRETRNEHEVDALTSKLRIYTISDQDNAGPWIRLNFPQIPYIVSIHGFNQYGQATWVGMHSGIGSDLSLSSQNYSSKHFQIGPLGAKYPDIIYGMEGDTPTFLHTMQNGVNGGPLDHPEWGGWGGRYSLVDPSRQTLVYANTQDSVVGIDNERYTTAQATIWRWRQAFQDEMSARMQWTILSNYSAGSHPPVVSVNGSCGSQQLEFEVDPEQIVILDGSGSYDPDEGLPGHDGLEYKWWQYGEITSTMGGHTVPQLNFTLSEDGRKTSVKMPTAEAACDAVETQANLGLGVQPICQDYHVIFEVKGSGSPPITRYKRVILKVQSPIAAKRP